MSITIEEDEDKGPQWAEEESIQTIIKESVENVLKASDYEKEKVTFWTIDIGEQCLRGISALQKPFKFIVEVTIMQRNGAGFHAATACYWEASLDGTAFFRWDNETIHCIVCVLGVAI